MENTRENTPEASLDYTVQAKELQKKLESYEKKYSTREVEKFYKEHPEKADELETMLSDDESTEKLTNALDDLDTFILTEDFGRDFMKKEKESIRKELQRNGISIILDFEGGFNKETGNFTMRIKPQSNYTNLQVDQLLNSRGYQTNEDGTYYKEYSLRETGYSL